MDAFVKNKSEAELLKILKEVSDILSLDLSLEIEALEEGGVKGFVKFVKKNKKLSSAVLAGLGVILTGVLTTVISDYATTDHEKEELEKKELRLRIQKLEKEHGQTEDEQQQQVIINEVTILLLNHNKIRLYQSNFYRSLLQEARLTQISTTELNEFNEIVDEEKKVSRSDFKKFVVDKVALPTVEVEDANVEIVSPVLGKNKLKWRGIYNGETISFNMMDTLFRSDVLNRKYSFSNGSAIRCSLEIHRELDEDGNEKTTNVNAYDVMEFFEGSRSFETRTSRRKRMGGGEQLDLGFSSTEE